MPLPLFGGGSCTFGIFFWLFLASVLSDLLLSFHMIFMKSSCVNFFNFTESFGEIDHEDVPVSRADQQLVIGDSDWNKFWEVQYSHVAELKEVGESIQDGAGVRIGRLRTKWRVELDQRNHWDDNWNEKKSIKLIFFGKVFRNTVTPSKTRRPEFGCI